VEAARQRLLLLGLTRKQVAALRSPSQIVSDVVVPAPIDGVITSRSGNLGQVVGMDEELFMVTDLSELWTVGDLYEQDFQTVGVGSEAALTTLAYPNLTLRGRVTSIDPRVDPQTRTAKLGWKSPTLRGVSGSGMYVTMAFSTARGERVTAVPRAAVQTIGGRQVVFIAVPDEEGKFVQRMVTLGPLIGESYTVLQGLNLEPWWWRRGVFSSGRRASGTRRPASRRLVCRTRKVAGPTPERATATVKDERAPRVVGRALRRMRSAA
jgi:RND family efflux transporter MFP subunit